LRAEVRVRGRRKAKRERRCIVGDGKDEDGIDVGGGRRELEEEGREERG
jgi:hypothetical protein